MNTSEHVTDANGTKGKEGKHEQEHSKESLQ